MLAICKALYDFQELHTGFMLGHPLLGNLAVPCCNVKMQPYLLPLLDRALSKKAFTPLEHLSSTHIYAYDCSMYRQSVLH